MSLSRKPIPQNIQPTTLEYIDTDKISLYRPQNKPVYSGKMPATEEEEKEADWDAKSERHQRLLAIKSHKTPHPPPLAAVEINLEPDRDLEQAMLASELCVWLTGDVDRERRARLHQSHLDHARKSYYCTGAPVQLDENDPDTMGSVFFRPTKDSQETSPPWIASQADIRTTTGAPPQRTASKCYVKGYTPRKVTRPQRSKSSLELV